MATATRRSSHDVRQLILDAAARSFTTSDYGSTSTRSIAAAAGVSESVLFRHFGSKSNLLAASVAEPFLGFLETFTRTWEREVYRRAPDSDERIVRAFVTDLYDSLASRRAVLRTLFGASGAPDAADLVAQVQAQLDGTFSALEELGRHSGVAQWPAKVRVRATVAMILSLAVFDDWFLAPEDRDRPVELVDQLSALVLYGVRGAPA